MAKRVFIAIAIVAFAVCALAFAQTRKVTDNTKIGVVEVKRAQLVEDPTLRGVAKSEEGRVIPWHINYQGYLTDDVGTPINGTLSMTFSIWTLSSGGSELWNEPQVVTVEDGLFNVVLGVSTPVPASVFELGESRWLELEVEAQTLSPRTEVTSVGYAYRAVKTDSADYASGSDMVDGFDASATAGPNDLFPLSYGDGQYVNEGQADAVTSPMVLDGTIQRADAEATFKAPYADTADYALSAPAGVDSDWAVTGSVLHPVADYGIAMRSSNVLHGDSTHSHVNFGIACTTGTSGQNYQYCTVSGGSDNVASGHSAVVGGGQWNTAGGTNATVSAGQSNTASADWATVSGGLSNTASEISTTVGGGESNTASSDYCTVGGGESNTASGLSATVGGGALNRASAGYATVSGGYWNAASGWAATVAGGWTCNALGDYSFAAGREVNIAPGADHAFAFGRNFTASTPNAVIFHNSVDDIRVGVGTITPTQKLDVNGAIKIGGSVEASDSTGAMRWTGSEFQGFDGSSWRKLDVQVTEPDTDWIIAGSVLHPGADYGLAMRGSNVLYGDSAHTHVNFGVACTTGSSGLHLTYCTVGGGSGNVAGGEYTTVGGGRQNATSSWYATVGGGYDNMASGNQATVSGGHNNTATDYATVSGGENNAASAQYATVGGGFAHTASGDYTTVGGGLADTASGAYATVGGGDRNTASGTHAVVGGGSDNTASGTDATVSGGLSNASSGDWATVGGGSYNNASGVHATVAGGDSNTAGEFGTVAGGVKNNSGISYGTVGGGLNNQIAGMFGLYATIGGGQDNIATREYATVGGGRSNTCDAQYSTISGGSHSRILGSYGTVGGGYADTVTGDYSFAAGRHVIIDAAADYTFAFGRDFTTSTPNAVIFHNAVDPIRVGMGTTSPTATLDVNGSTGYDQLRMRSSYTPAGTADPNGNVGDIAWDDNYIYLKTTAGWKRAALSTW